jgi:hypothetical protein
MSEFDEALARAVQDGIARGGLPGAADAVRRGRRRSLRARGGVTVLGVAVVAGALGGAGFFGSGVGGSAVVGAAAGAANSFSDYGVLPASQWPGYDTEHWTVSAHCGLADRSKCKPGDPSSDPVTETKISEWWGVCTPGRTYPVRRYASFTTQRDEARKVDEDESVFTFPDRATAAAFLADARAAGSPKVCGTEPGYTATSTPGVSTSDGLSWLASSKDAMASYEHGYLVQVDDRVAMLRVLQEDGDTMPGTENDALVLADMAQALAK